MHVEGRGRTIGWWTLYAALIVAAAFRLPVLYDEAYYWTWSRTLASSYVDHPPGIAYILRAFTTVLGDGYLGLRTPALMAMGIVGFTCWVSARRLSTPETRGRAGELAIATLGGSLMFGLGYLASTPDPYQGAILSLGACFLIDALGEHDGTPARRGSAFGASFCFLAAVLIKLSSFAVLIGVVVGLVSHPKGRRLLRAPGFMAGAISALFLGLPWLSAEWMAIAGSVASAASAATVDTPRAWTLAGMDVGRSAGMTAGAAASAAFQWARVAHGHPARGLVAVPLVLGAMMLTFGPLTTLSLGRLSVATLKPRVWKHDHPAHRALLWGSAVLLLACMGAAWLGAGELNWPMPALITAAPVIAARVARDPPAHRRWFAWSTRVFTGLVMVLLVHVVHPFLPMEAGRDRTLRSAGFDTVTHAVEVVARKEGVKAVLVDRYQLASMLRYHSLDRLKVVERGRARRSQYDVWPRPRLCPGDRVLVVGLGPGVASEGIERQGEERVIERRRGDRRVGAFYWALARVARPMFGDGCPLEAEVR
ncbi:MAG: glycosyltransferase family 39 protein [Deltaproteobacteria bacterium]|nr:glycosyltransferase family 39 protein [Deltaproteobacteria bacterium]